MIKFIPKLVSIDSPLSDIENFVNNSANEGIANQLNDRFKDFHCPDHPSFENIMEVHFNNTNHIMTVKSFCCANFKSKLDLLTKNKNPF